MTSADIASVFGLLDRWRHLPTYQLERRADVFFGLFLPDVLNWHLSSRGITIDPWLVPEFPIRRDSTRRSNRVDYLALSTDRTRAFLVELKTEPTSLGNKQLDFLRCAEKRGMGKLLCDVKFIAKARDPRARRKYFHFLKALARLDLFSLPPALEERIYCSPRGVYACIDEIEIVAIPASLELVLVLPDARADVNCIEFAAFANGVESQGEIGTVFANHLRSWASNEAGSRKAGCGSSPT